jgi:DNA-binding transcriptional MerR regulator
MTLPVENDVVGGRIAPAAGAELVGRRPGKAAGAFRTISEVANDLNVPQHVLRFWETRFTQIRPLKRAGGRRYYRPEDVELLRRIRQLLYNNGYTIKGVQRLLRDLGRRPDGEGGAEADAEMETPAAVAASAPEAAEAAMAPGAGAAPAGRRADIDAAVRELAEIRDGLRRLRR